MFEIKNLKGLTKEEKLEEYQIIKEFQKELYAIEKLYKESIINDMDGKNELVADTKKAWLKIQTVITWNHEAIKADGLEQKYHNKETERKTLIVEEV